MSDSSLLELLSVTDKAVKSLNKSHSSRSSQSSISSHHSITKDSSIKSQTENVTSKSPDHDLSDVSTTASDVLIKSTIIENDDKHQSFASVSSTGDQNRHSTGSGGSSNGAKVSSSESKCSRTSIGVDNFNSSGPQKIKISTKKLREIKSPSGSDLSSPRSDIIAPPLVTNANGHSEKSSNIPRDKPLVTRHFTEGEKKTKPAQSSFPPVAKQPIFPVSDSNNNADDEVLQKPSMGKKFSETDHSPLSSDDKSEKSFEKDKSHASVQSIREGSSSSDDVIIERHGPKITKPTKSSLEAAARLKEKLLELEDSIDMEPQKESVVTVEAVPSHSVNTSCTDSDRISIVTIPERIVTVSARTSVSEEVSYTSEEGERIPPRLESRVLGPHKHSSHLLRQGAPVDGVNVQDKQKQTSDVQISQFTSSDRQKIKDSLAKRQENAGPIKRVVQPRLVNHKVPEPPKPSEPSTSHTDTVTASVAASVAVAATAPFLKAQQELENKMKDMLEKISDIQSGKQVKVEDDRVKELERQVSALTEQRIQHLEKLQEHNAEMQAKLLSMTRSAPKRRPASPETPTPTPVTHRRPGVSNFGPKKAFSKTTVGRPKSTSPSRTGTSPTRPGTSPTRSEHSRICDSPYDTPNPRSKAPRPVAYNNSAIETRDQKSRGILEEILASSESPRPRYPSPQPQVPRSSYSEDFAKSPVVQKAERLVHDLSGINDDVKSVVNEIDRCKELDEKKRQVERKREELLEPSPLDAYLTTSSKNFTTPYKSFPDIAPHHFNAPLPPGFSEAEQVLQDVTKTRAFLEANLQTVLRSQHEAEVYATLESLYQNSSDPERAVLQQKVDKWVTKLRQQVQNEITDDMVIKEMQKSHLPVYKVPPPPTITAATQPAKGRGRGGAPKVEVKPRPGARIDTGLGKRIPGKENKPDPVVKRARAPYEDEAYMTQVYGKASYQGKRTTMKDPYLHFRNDPKQKQDRPPGVVDSEGHTVKSARTQTQQGIKQFYFSPTHGTYIPISTTSAGPIPGSLVPMAVPLGGPRMDGGLTVPVTMTTQGPAVTSTPVSRSQVTAGKNVTLVSIPAEESLRDEKPVPELSKQVLPNVDIDTDLSEISDKKTSKKSGPTSARSDKSKSEKSKSKRSKSPPKTNEKTVRVTSVNETQESSKRSVVVQSPQPSVKESSKRSVVVQSPQHSIKESSKRSVVVQPPQSSVKESFNATFGPGQREEDGDITDASGIYEDDFSPESAPGMELPGYRPPTPPEYREPGPSFPPKIPGQEKIMAASNVLAEDIRRRELIENKAVEWVEQELMARAISQYATKRRIEPPQIAHTVDDVEESVSSDHEDSMFLMDAIGHQGLQLFIDAGVPVDSSLINSLVKECLLEKVVGMLGQKPDDVRTGTAQIRTETKMAAGGAGVREQEEKGYVREDEFGQRQVRTPQPTPKSSPVMSPVRVMSPPYTPPGSPPIEQEVPTHRPPAVVQPEYDSEISESVDISEEIRILQGQLVRQEDPAVSREVHSVETPVPTPVPEEVPEVKEERPVTPPPPTPRQEVIVQPKVVEIPPEPEVIKPEVKDTASSPVPWGNPESPLPEENPDHDEDMMDHPQPIVLSAAPGEDEMTIPPTTPPATIVPPREQHSTPKRSSSPAPSDDTTSIETSISDSINQSVSMGQWLLSKSDGEVADYILDDDLRQRIARSTKHKGDHSVADTLRDTTDLVDESIDPVSEGEFQHKVNLSPEKDPVLHFIASLQKSPQVKQGQYEMPSNQVWDVLNQTGKSMGEVSMMGDHRYSRDPVYQDKYRDQQYREQSYQDRYYQDQSYPGYDDRYRDQQYREPVYQGRQSPSRRSPDRERRMQERDRRSPGYVSHDRQSRSPDQRRHQSPEYRERDRRSPEYRDLRSPEVRDRRSPDTRGSRSPTQKGRRSPQRSDDRRTRSPQQKPGQEVYYSNGFSPQGTRQSYNSELDTQDSLRASDLRRSSVEFNDTPQIMSGSRRGGKRQQPGAITVSPGGLMAGGRSPLKSALRKPPQVQKSGGQPDRSVSKSQHQVLNVRSSDQEMKDSLEGSQNLYGFNSNDQRSSRAYTPDQMNLDALVQSGYLTQSLTYSAELAQSGNMSQSVDRSSYKDSLEYHKMSPTRTKRGQSLGLTYSYDEKDDLKRTDDFEGTGTLKMSVTLPTLERSNSELSEIDITDRNIR